MADGILHGGQAIAAAITDIADQRRKKQEASAKALLDAGQRNPAVLDDPDVFKSIKKYAGDEQTARALIESARQKSLPGQAVTTLGAIGVPEETIRQSIAKPGAAPLPEGVPGPTQPQPTQTEVGQAALGALPEIAQQKGFGVEIGPQGIKVRQTPPSRSEAGEMAALQGFETTRAQLADSGLEPDKVDVLSARLTVSALAKSGMIPPAWMREMAMASTEDALAAAREKAVKTAGAQVEQTFAAGTAAEKARGQVTGKAAGEAATAFQTMTVTRPDGTKVDIPLSQASAFAATGEPTAVSLGKSPSKEQMEAAAQRGADLVIGGSGEMIMVPIGTSPSGVPAAAILQGQEALSALDEVRRVIADIDKPEFLSLFPSEKEVGRATARSAGYAKSWIRNLTDPASALAKRGELRQTGFRLARLSGSNSQLSDAERENAERVIKPVIEGTATQEQVIEAKKSLDGMLNTADKRRRTGQPVPNEPASDEWYKSHGLPNPRKKAESAKKPAQTGSIGDRQNNPGHVKATAFTRRLPGFVGEGKSATDGGKFAIFDSPESGRAAIDAVLVRIHGSKSVATALKQYSGGGYNVNKVAADAGVDPKQSVASLTPEQRSTLIDSMIGAEGSSTGLSREARAAKLAAQVNAGKLTAAEAAEQLRGG